MARKAFIDNLQSTDLQSFYDRLVRMLGLSKGQPKEVQVKMTEQEFLAKTQPKELTLDEIAARFGIPVELLKIKK